MEEKDETGGGEGDSREEETREEPGERRRGEGGGRDLITRHRSRFPECLLYPSLFSASPCTPLSYPFLSRRHPCTVSPTELPQPPRTVNTDDVGPSRSRPSQAFSILPSLSSLFSSLSLPPAESSINSCPGVIPAASRKYAARVAPLISTLYHCERLCTVHIWANIWGSRGRAARTSIILKDIYTYIIYEKMLPFAIR